MTLEYVGSLPTSGLQLGLAATLPGIAAKISGLQSLIPDLQAALTAKATMAVNFPPNVAGITAAAAAYLNPTALAALLNPATWVSASAGASADILVDLGLIIPQIELLARITGELTVGMSAGGIAEWAYHGTAQGFGQALSWELRSSTGGIPRDAVVSGLVIACEDSSSWDSFGEGFNTGDPYPGSATFVGSLTGGEIVTGLTLPMLELEAYLAELNGLRAALELNLDLSLGLNIPPIGELLSVDFDLEAAIGSLVEIDADITGEISLVTGKIDALLELQGRIQASLSGGGLSVWRYSGPIYAMGDELDLAIEGGLPGGGGASARVSGVALACASPAAWGAFGNLVPV